MEQLEGSRLALFAALGQICERISKEDAQELATSIGQPHGIGVDTVQILQKKAQALDSLEHFDFDENLQLPPDIPRALADKLGHLQKKARVLETIENDNAICFPLYDSEKLAAVLRGLKQRFQIVSFLDSHQLQAELHLPLDDPAKCHESLKLFSSRVQWVDSLAAGSDPKDISTGGDTKLEEIGAGLAGVQEKAKAFDELTNSSEEIDSLSANSLYPTLNISDAALSRLRERGTLARTLTQNRALHDLLSIAQQESSILKTSLETAKRDANYPTELHARLKKVSEAHETLLLKYRSMRENKNLWLDYAKALEKRLGKNENALPEQELLHRVPSHPSGTLTVPPADAECDGVSKDGQLNDAPERPRASSVKSEVDLDGDTVIGTPQNAATGESPRLPRHTRTGSIPDSNDSQPQPHSSSTEGDPDALQADDVQPTTPAVAAEPSSDSPVFVSARPVRKRRVKESPKKVKVKEEIDYSSPVGMRLFGTQNSVDLDEIGPKTATPKKKIQAANHYEYNMDEMLEGDRHYKHPPVFHTAATEQNAPRTTPQTKAPSARRTTSALQEKSPNKRILPRAKIQYPPAKRRQTEDRAGLLPEDGGNDYIDSATPSRRPKQQKVDAAATRKRSIWDTGREASFKEKEDTHGHGAVQKATPGGRHPKLRAVDENEPLRARPLEHLRLEDFKINPAYNGGSKYAFHDVVRGREKRKCLPGCTNPECCGNAFRKIAELTAGDIDTPTASQETADNDLLEEYLGADSGRLRRMSKEERKETLMEAKTRQLANRHGKHRHAFERRKSPPGFWRTDFPSTQELETDRAKAAEVEMESKRGRYEDAMRGGGKWMFRDE